MKATGKSCAACNRPHGVMRERGDIRVLLCDECQVDWFRRERAYCEARGEKWDPAKAGAPTR